MSLWKSGLPEWVSIDNMFIAFAFLGLLVWRGVTLLKGVKTLDDVFKSKKSITEVQLRHEAEISDLQLQVADCHKNRSELEMLFDMLDELAESADVEELDVLPTSFVQALLNTWKKHRRSGH